MQKIIKEVDKERGIVQITCADERWYFKPSKNEEGVPVTLAVPSVTWIAGYYPKGIAFYKWLAQKGWDEAEAIKSAAGDKGSKVHQAIVDILDDKEVRIDSKYANSTTGISEELAIDECEAILSFVSWKNDAKPQVIAREFVVFSEKMNYAGTVDLLCKIGDGIWLLDFKTSQNIWPEYELQISAYSAALIENTEILALLGEDSGKLINLGILQVGYWRNKNKYKFNKVEDKFKLFSAAQLIWRNENEGVEPARKDIPIILSPAKPEKETKVAEINKKKK